MSLREKEKKQQLAAKSEEAVSKQTVKLTAILASRKAHQHHERKVKRLAKTQKSNKKIQTFHRLHNSMNLKNFNVDS